VKGANDFAMVQETLRRRFKRAISDNKETVSDTWKIMPDLVLIDGGKGQLSAAREVMKELGMESVPLASLAKENEELYIPNQAKPIVLAKSSLGLRLLQRLRDEAHRFAITYFQKVHRKRTFTSALDEIPGVGPKKKKMLIKQFGSVQGIREATLEDLAKVEGIPHSLALKIKETL
jgi:excinuclease ABC subunit C